MNTHRDQAESNCCTPSATLSRSVETPRHDVFEDAGGFGVHVYLPGVHASNISVEYADRALVVRGTRVRPDEPASYLQREFGEHDYELKLRIGERVDAEKIDAEYKSGVLTLRLPKADEAKSRTILVRND